MKRDFLENLGLEKQTVDSIMAEYGRSVEAVKSAEADRLKTAEENTENLKNKLEELEKQIAGAALRAALSAELKKAGIVSLLAEEAAFLRLTAAGPDAEKDIPGFVAALKGSDPDSFTSPLPDPASLPKFSRPGTADPSDRSDPLFDNGVPLFSFRRPVR